MTDLYIVLLIVLPLVFAIFSPAWSIYISLLIGPLPMSFGVMTTLQELGRMDASAFRLLGLCLAAFFIIISRPIRALASFKYSWPHFVFLVFSLATFLWTPSMLYSTRMLAKLAAPLLIFTSMYCVIIDERKLKMMEYMILASGILSIFIAIPTYIMKVNVHPGLSLPNTTPALFSAHVVAVGCLMLSSISSKRRLFPSLFAVACIVAVLMADTRNTIVGVFVSFSVVLFLTLHGAFRIVLPTLGIVVVPSLFLFVSKFRARMFIGGERTGPDEFLRSSSETFSKIYGSGRFAAWEEVMNRFFYTSPFFGSGIGATQHMYYTHATAGVGVIHSEYVRLLAEVGIIGTFAFFSAIIMYVTYLMTILPKKASCAFRKYAVTAIAGIVSYVIFMATDNAFDYVTSYGQYVFAFIAMAFSARDMKFQRK